ncbi:neuropeptide FF receptor 2-like [Branchiostoma floridae x Branchiostoma belcheri]
MEEEGNMTNDTFVELEVSFFKHDLGVSLVFIGAYAVLCLLCVVGNGTVCCLVAQNKKLHTVTNFFILNLAVADLMIAVFCMPITLVNNIVTEWVFGDVVCKLTPFMQGLSVGASVFTLVAIATDRYVAIVLAPNGRIREKQAGVIIAVVWMLAAVIMAPHAAVMEARPHPYIQGHACQEYWPDVRYRMAYTVVLFLLLFVAPLLTVAFMYTKVTKQTCKKPPTCPHTLQPDSGARQLPSWTDIFRFVRKNSSAVDRDYRKARVVRMLLVVVILFAICWLPLHLVTLVGDFANLTYDQLVFVYDYLYPVAHFLAYFNSCVNPIVYGYYNKNFTRMWREMNGTVRLCCCKNEKSSRSENVPLTSFRTTAVVNTQNVSPYRVAELARMANRL